MRRTALPGRTEGTYVWYHGEQPAEERQQRLANASVLHGQLDLFLVSRRGTAYLVADDSCTIAQGSRQGRDYNFRMALEQLSEAEYSIYA